MRRRLSETIEELCGKAPKSIGGSAQLPVAVFGVIVGTKKSGMKDGVVKGIFGLFLKFEFPSTGIVRLPMSPAETSSRDGVSNNPISLKSIPGRK